LAQSVPGYRRRGEGKEGAHVVTVTVSLAHEAT
jgi:hypothetical protein